MQVVLRASNAWVWRAPTRCTVDVGIRYGIEYVGRWGMAVASKMQPATFLEGVSQRGLGGQKFVRFH